MNLEMKRWKSKTALFLVSQAITLFGSSLVQFAIIWHVTLQTSSGLWVTLLTLSSFLPQMLVSLFAGVWADRFSRKKLIIFADAGIALATLGLALFLRGRAAQTTGGLIAIVLVSALRSLGSGIQTPAVNAVVPQLAPPQNLPRVNGLNATVQSIVQFAAPAAAGAVLAFGSLQSILYIDIATAALGVGLLAFLPIPGHAATPGTNDTGFLGQLKDGLRYTNRNGFVKKLLLLYGAFIFFSVPSGFLATLMVERTFAGGYFYLSVVEMLGFAGSALGGVLLGVWGGFKNRNKTLALGLLAYGIFSLAVGLASSFWLFAAMMFGVGLCIPIAQTMVTTLVQEKVNPNYLGRVFSLVSAMFTGVMPLGMLVFGPLADIVPVQALVVGCAVPIIALGILIVQNRRFYLQGAAATPLLQNNAKAGRAVE